MISPLRAAIVDDDPFHSQLLEQLIREYVPFVDVITQINDPAEALQILPALRPDIVFLDVEMPGMNGFELLTRLGNIGFGIIFTTMHNHYAIRAIRFAAIDYLLKPVDITALQEAVSRAKERMNYYSNLPAQQSAQPKVSGQNALEIFAVPTHDGVIFLKVADIVYCESSDRYVKVHMTGGKNTVVSRTLQEFEELLEGSGFIRIHKSYLVNILHIQKYYRTENTLKLSNNTLVDVARSRKEELLRRIAQI